MLFQETVLLSFSVVINLFGKPFFPGWNDAQVKERGVPESVNAELAVVIPDGT